MTTPRDINFIKSKDVTEESLFLDLKQFEERPVIGAIIKTVASMKQSLYDEAVVLAEVFLLDLASGQQLDTIGEELGIPRLGQDDNTYRVFLQLTSYKARNTGTRPELINIISRIVGGELDNIVTYSGIHKSSDLSLFLACFDTQVVVDELKEALPILTNYRIIDRFGNPLLFNSEIVPALQREDTGLGSVFDEVPNLTEEFSKIGSLVSSADSYITEFPYTGVVDRFKETTSGFGTSAKLTRDSDGSFIKIRRSSDDTTLTIGSINNQIDGQDIIDFVGVSNAFVVEWFDQVGGFHFVQNTNSLQPQLDINDISMTFDLVDDELSVSGLTPFENGAFIINTVYGNVQSLQDIPSTIVAPPFLKLKELIVISRKPKLGEYNSYVRMFNTPKQIFIGSTTNSTIFHRVDTTRVDGNYQIDFYGGNEASYSVTTNNTTTDLVANGLTSPFAITIPFDTYRDGLLTVFDISGNSLNGYFPNFEFMTGITTVNLSSNLIQGNVCDLSRLTNLTSMDVSNNQIVGYLSHTEVGVLPIAPALGEFNAQNNLLSQNAVDKLLADFVEGGRTSADGTCVLTLDGTGNSAPSAQGTTDKNTLISRGWTVLTN